MSEGASLFEIDRRPYKVELDRAEATLAQQEAHSKRLDADYRRVANLFARGSVSREEFDRYAGDRAESSAAVGIARANHDMAKLNLGFTNVRAPIGGLLSRRLVDPGNMVQADMTALTTIVSLDPMYLYFDIDERTVLKLRVLVREGKLPSREEGSVVPILAALADEEGFPHKGVINFSDNKVNPKTGTLRVRGVLENPVVKGKNARLLSPGLFARVRLPLSEPQRALLVSERAIDTDQGQKILYLVDDKNEVASRPVRLGAIHDGLRAIEDGLKAGERVIVVGLQQVRPGAVVEPKLVDMPVSSARSPGASASVRVAQGLRMAGSFERTNSGQGTRAASRCGGLVMLARFFIDRPVLAWVISIVIVLLGRDRRGPAADRPVPGDHAADRPRRGHLPRGQRPGGRRHGGGPHRAAGQRRREHALHVVAEQQRRLVHPGRDLRAGDRPQHGPGPGAEPRRHRPADAARRGQGHRRDRQEAVAGHPARRQPVFRGRPGDRPAALRPALPEQLRHHQPPGRAGPHRRRGRRLLLRPAGLQHARVARPGQAGVAEPDRRRRDPGPAGAERAGGGRADRPAPRPARPGLPVHADAPWAGWSSRSSSRTSSSRPARTARSPISRTSAAPSWAPRTRTRV